MASKFDRAHAELRVFIPVDSPLWDEVRESKAFQVLLQSGIVTVNNARKAQTNGKAKK
ncbi:MAG: hypothetical protein AB7P76_07495 [Candidatus Melainabacteria bacterium]